MREEWKEFEIIDRWTNVSCDGVVKFYLCPKCDEHVKDKSEKCPNCGQVMIEKRKPLMTDKEYEDLVTIGCLFDVAGEKMGLKGKYDIFTDVIMFKWDDFDKLCQEFNGEKTVKYL